MSPERLAEIRKGYDCEPSSPDEWLIRELIDALTAERELTKRLQAQIQFERGLVAEATGHSFHPPERKTDLDAVVDAVRGNRDALASANLRTEKAVELAEDLFDWITSGDIIGADEIKGWAERLGELGNG